MRIVLPALLLWAYTLAVVPVAQSAESVVRDDAGFFSASARDQAQRSLQEIQQRTGKVVIVETYPALPEALQDRFKRSTPQAFYREWRQERARELGANILILIVRSPSHLEIYNNLLREADAKKLIDGMLSEMRQKKFDAALTDGVNFIQKRSPEVRTTTAPAGSAAPVPPPGGTPPGTPPARTPNWIPDPSKLRVPEGGLGVGKWLCIGAAVLIVIMLFRAMRGAGRYRGGGPMGGGQMGGGPGYGPGYGGGGGFGSGMMGGLLGGLLGGWAADRAFGSGHSHQHPNDAGASGLDSSQAGNDFAPGGTDFGGGGDFGSGGSDFGGGGDYGGGGDFGGGDFGGGDSGGGGDF